MHSIPLEQIHPNPEQPRRSFDEEGLRELAASIAVHGVIQPIAVEPRPEGGYTLRAGERRWRAARLAGLAAIPAHIVDPADDRTRLEQAIVENVQREDMNPLEEGLAYRRLRDEFAMPMMEIARRVGRAQATVSSRIQWTEFEPEIQALVRDGSLSSDPRVQKALRSLPDEARLAFARRMAAAGVTIPGIQKAAAVMASALAGGTKRSAPRPESRETSSGEPRFDDCPGEARKRRSACAHSVRLVFGDCPMPGPLGALLEAAALEACRLCALFEYRPSASCHECAATVMVRVYAREARDTGH
jgi:ParB family transcriptional regulator, chromosome partitioning protein